MSKERELEIRKEIALKNNEIQEIRKEVIVLRQKLLEEETGFKEGDKVINTKGKVGILCFDNRYLSFWSWRKLKKDGTPSLVISYIAGGIERRDNNE